MSNPFLGEMRIVSFNFAPKGWAMCNGQLLPINQNQALFSLLGTTYGGDGRVNFALPDLRGRAPMHVGGDAGLVEGQSGGQTAHTLTTSEMPAHNHFLNANVSPDATLAAPANNYFGKLGPVMYGGAGALTTLQPATISNVGGSQPHENMQPYLVLMIVIALVGIFPSQT